VTFASSGTHYRPPRSSASEIPPVVQGSRSQTHVNAKQERSPWDILSKVLSIRRFDGIKVQGGYY